MTKSVHSMQRSTGSLLVFLILGIKGRTKRILNQVISFALLLHLLEEMFLNP
jgi:hypothetical protein